VNLALSVLVMVAMAASRGFAADPKYSGFLGDATVYSQLAPGPEGGVKMRWLKLGVAKEAFKFWAERLQKFLGEFRGKTN